MAIKFSDRVFGANVEKKIIDIFDNLQKGSFDQKPLSETAPTHQDYLGDRTPFARMWTATLISGSKRQEIVYNIVNDNRGKSYVEINEPIGDGINTELAGSEDNPGNPYLKPKAGITSITSKTEGALGAIKSTDVSFVVHNKRDFEDIFLPYFLKPGSTVVVDYGWSDKSFAPYDVSKTISNTDLELSQFKNDTYGGIDKKPIGFINDNLGLVDTLIGKVTNYNASVNQQGSFECSVTLTSENTSLLDTEITEDNNLKFIFANKIEEIIIKTLTSDGSEDKVIGNTELSSYSKLSAKDKQQVREKFWKSLLDPDKDGKLLTETGVIPESAVKSGLFYQDVTDIAGIKQNDKDVLYINYGLFEDLFLNTLIAENKIKDSTSHRVNYNTKDTFVRYEPNLLARQKELLGTNEPLSLFLYPNDWRNSYNNKKKPLSDSEYRSQKQIKLGEVQHKNDYNVKIIPFRELFISVALISKIFSQKQNINDALDSMLEAINQDSYEVFKLKMISLNKSYSSLSIQDVNLIPEPPAKPKDLLTFDVTSDKSIVSGLDYKFGMPKGGLASMIAIGEKDDFAFFDETSSDNLNFLRILGPNKDEFGDEVFFKALPLVKSDDEKPDKEQKTAYDFSQNKVSSVIKDMDVTVPDDIKTDWTALVAELRAAAETAAGGVNTQPPTTTGVDFDFEYEDEQNILPANSIRDYYGKLANLNTILNNKTTSVSPILPIELTLTIYGNTYLQIGDIFSINFLPDFYQDNIMFQILNIEQKVSSNWETTYSTVMRLRPDRKGDIVKPNLKKPMLSIQYTNNLLSGKHSQNKHILPATRTSTKINIDVKTMLAHEIVVRYDDNVIKVQDSENLIVKISGGTKGDVRLLKLEFLDVITPEDIAFVIAFQKTIKDYIYMGALKEKDMLIHVKKELKPELDMGHITFQTDIFITALVEDKGWSDNAALLYLKNLSGITETQEEALLKKIAKNPKLKTFYETYLKQTYVGGGKTSTSYGLVETMSVGEKVKPDNVDDNFGFIMSSIGFVFARGEFQDVRHIYSIDVHGILNLTENIPQILIPDWFFENAGSGVNDFCNKLDANLKETIIEIKQWWSELRGGK